MGAMSSSSCLLRRPGGFDITDKALKHCSFRHGAKILDIGCGSGATVRYMNDVMALDAVGIDIEPAGQSDRSIIIKASASDIPFPGLSFDGIITECSFSLMSEPERVLEECHRVLKEKGRIIISDMYARGNPAVFNGTLGRLDTKETIIFLLQKKGFFTELFEDHTHALQTMWGQMIFDMGAASFHDSLGVTPGDLKKVKCGYYLLVARKTVTR